MYISHRMAFLFMEKSGSGTVTQYAPGIAALGYYAASRASSSGRAVHYVRPKPKKWYNKLKMRRRARAPKYFKRPRGRGRRRGVYRSRPLTSQNDNKVYYRKRRMGRRARRRAKGKYRAFTAQIMKREPANIFPYVDVDNITWSDNTSVYFGAFMGLLAQNNYDNNFGEAWSQITDGNTASVKAAAGKFRCDSMSLRVVIRNVTTIGEGTTATATVDLDVYEVMCIKDLPLDLWPSGVGIESFLVSQKNILRQPKGMEIEVGTSGSGIASVQHNTGTSSTTQVVGDTLFNNPLALRYFKVTRAMKIQLPSDGVTEFEIRDSKSHTITRESCYGLGSLAAKAYVTRGFIFNVNGRVFYSSGGTPNFSSGTLYLEQYVRYNIKEIGTKSPTLVYDGI